MKTKTLLAVTALLLASGGVGLALAQQPAQQEQQQPPQQEQPVQVTEPLNLVVEEAVICTAVVDRAPQGVPTAPLATSQAAATETKPDETTTTTQPATAAPTGGGGDPFSFVQGVGKLYCFTKVAGATTATTIKHIWYFGDTVVHTMELNLGGSPWRTWSNKTIAAEWTGAGKVEIQDASSTVLKTVHFVVQ